MIRDLRHLPGFTRRLFEGREGWRRAQRVLAFRLLRNEAVSLTFRRGGLQWTVPCRDSLISQKLFETGGFQQEQLLRLVSWLQAHDFLTPERQVVIDVGANIGTTSVPVARATGCRVLALEPDPSNFAYLLTNVAANDLAGRVTCSQLGIADQPGRVTMVVNPISAGATAVLNAHAHAAGPVFDADVMRLDDVLVAQSVRPESVAFVWSDTEGFERQVIDSGRTLWAAGSPLYVEVWPAALEEHGGWAAFVATATECFEAMIPSRELVSAGADAAVRPISALREFITSLPPRGSDVLLLPGSAVQRHR